MSSRGRTTNIQPTAEKVSKEAMTPRQRLFVDYLLADPEFNITVAGQKAGYKPRTAYMAIKHKLVRAYLGRKIFERMEKCEVTAERVLKELSVIAFADPGKIYNEDGIIPPINEMPEAIRRCISSVKVRERTIPGTDVREVTTEIKFWDKVEALNLIAKHLGMMIERLDVHHPVSEDFLAELIHRVEDSRNVIDSKVIHGD